MAKPTAVGVEIRFWIVCASYATWALVNAVLGALQVLNGHWTNACFNIGAVTVLAAVYRWVVRPLSITAYRKARKHDQAVREDEIAALEKELGIR